MSIYRNRCDTLNHASSETRAHVEGKETELFVPKNKKQQAYFLSSCVCLHTAVVKVLLF